MSQEARVAVRVVCSDDVGVKVRALVAVVGWVAMMSGSDLQAHQPPGRAISAYQFPDYLTPSIDGDLDDWQIVDPSYCYLSDQFTDLVAGAVADVTDFRVTLCVGWNETANKVYVSALVVDDIHQIDRPPNTPPSLIFQDDDLEIFVDPDHSGGQFADFSDLTPDEQLAVNGTQASHFILSGPPPLNGDFFVNFSAAGWYSAAEGPFTEAAVVALGTGVTAYELAFTPFDRIDVGASFLSVEHDLREGEVIGFNAEFNDFDVHSELYEAKWSLSGAHNAFRLSGRFTDLFLAPLAKQYKDTIIASPSWGQIKASIRP